MFALCFKPHLWQPISSLHVRVDAGICRSGTAPTACFYQSQRVTKKYIIKLDDDWNSFGKTHNRVLLLNLLSRAPFANILSEQSSSVFKSPVTFAENKRLARFTFQPLLDVLKLLSNCDGRCCTTPAKAAVPWTRESVRVKRRRIVVSWRLKWSRPKPAELLRAPPWSVAPGWRPRQEGRHSWRGGGENKLSTIRLNSGKNHSSSGVGGGAGTGYWPGPVEKSKGDCSCSRSAVESVWWHAAARFAGGKLLQWSHSERSWTWCQADAQWMEGGWRIPPQKDLGGQRGGRALQKQIPGLSKLPILLQLYGDLVLGTAFLVSTWKQGRC